MFHKTNMIRCVLTLIIVSFLSAPHLMGESAVRYSAGVWTVIVNTQIAARVDAQNALGHIAGTASSPTFSGAFFYDGGTITNIPALWGRGINSAGQVVGTGLSARAFVWNGSTVSELGNPGERHDALAISDAGVVVGSAWTGSYTPGVGARPIRHAVSFTGGAMTDLGTLGGTNAYA